MKDHFSAITGKTLIEQYRYKIIDTSSLAASITKYSFYKRDKYQSTAINFVDADILDYNQFGIINDMVHKELHAFNEAFSGKHLIYFKVFVTDLGLEEDIIGKIIGLYSLQYESSLIPVVVDLNNSCIILPDKNNSDCMDFYMILKQSLENSGSENSMINLEQVSENSTKTNQQFHTPYATYSVIAVNVIVFILTSLAGGLNNFNVLIIFGAKVNSLIALGQYWRLIASAFLHAGFAHLAFNMYGLYSIGNIVENIYGSKKFLYIYILSAIFGSISSFAFSSAASVGASGAVFGLFGAILYLGQKNPKIFSTSFGINILVVLGFNIIYGFSTAGIDNFAHLGGLVGGFLCANITGLERNTKLSIKKAVLIIVTAVLLSLLLIIGIETAPLLR